MSNFDGRDEITNEEYESLDEGAKRAFKRSGGSLSSYFRCTTGPKAGKLASDPSKCGQRPDPKKVRHGRKVAKLKGSIRIRKTKQKKKTELSKRITRMNKQLMGHNTSTKPKSVKSVKSIKRESFASFHGLNKLVEHILMTIDLVYPDTNLWETAMDEIIAGKYDENIINRFIAEECTTYSFEDAEPVAEYIIEHIEIGLD